MFVKINFIKFEKFLYYKIEFNDLRKIDSLNKISVEISSFLCIFIFVN